MSAPDTPEARGEYIVTAIFEQARRMERDGHGFDYWCSLTKAQFDEIRAARTGKGVTRHVMEFQDGQMTQRAMIFTHGAVFRLEIDNQGTSTEGVRLAPGRRWIGLGE